MKKLFAVLLALTLAASLAMCALAATNFVGSPSQKELPTIDVEIEGFEKVEVSDPEELEEGQYCVIEEENVITIAVKEDATCLDELIITPYGEKVRIPEDCPQDQENIAKAEKAKTMLEDAYEQVTEVGEGNLTALPTTTNPKVDFAGDLRRAASDHGTTVDNVYISDLFDITYYHTGNTEPGHEEKHQKKYTIKLNEETLKNYVALLHRHSGGTDSDGITWSGDEWRVVPGVDVSLENQSISFVIKDVHTDLSPFAIAVKKTTDDGDHGHGHGPASPKTADPLSFVTLGMAMVASAGGLVFLGKRKRS